MKKIRLSAIQLTWLRDLAAGRSPYLRKKGRSQMGGTVATKWSLFRHGFADTLGDITQKGRDYLASLEPPAGPPVRPVGKLTGVRYIGYANRVLDVHKRAAIRRAERAAPEEPPAQ